MIFTRNKHTRRRLPSTLRQSSRSDQVTETLTSLFPKDLILLIRNYAHEFEGLYSRHVDFDGTPAGLATDGTHIFACDVENHCVKVFDQKLRFVASYGTQGDGDNEFDQPTYVACDPTFSELFVSDCLNDRIQVLSTGGVFKHRFDVGASPKGLAVCDDLCVVMVTTPPILWGFSKSGQSRWATHLDADPGWCNSLGLDFADSKIYCVNNTEQQILCFDTSGRYEGNFSGFDEPLSVCASENELYVGGKNGVQVFDEKTKTITKRIGEEKKTGSGSGGGSGKTMLGNWICGVVIVDRRLFVADRDKKKVHLIK